MKFGENLYNLRKSAKMSQEKLAEKIGVTRQSVSKWENGESYPEMEKIMKLCNIFNCRLNDLVHEDMTDIDSLDEDIKMSVVKFKEEKQKKIKGISKAIYILSRIGKIITTIAIPIIVVLLIVTPIFMSNIELEDNKLIADVASQETILQMKNILENNSKASIIAYLELGFLCLIICLVLYRMTLSRLEKLFININKGDTPFTLENVKYIKEMAKLMIVSLVLPLCGGIIFEIILKSDLDVEFDLFDVIQILFLFGVSYIFEYGYELQLDSKGKMYGDENE